MEGNSISSRSKLPSAKEEVTMVRRSILHGAFSQGSIRQWRRPSYKLLVFISSTFTDTQLERNYLTENLVFRLRKMARPHGVQVIFADMRTGVRDENTLDHRTWQECASTLTWCKEESMGMCFLSLQGDKYGYRPLPRSIPKADFDAHVKELDLGEEISKLLQHWYQCDENAVPPQVTLRHMRSPGDEEYWSAYNQLLPVLSGIHFDSRGFDTLAVGQSVTEWEVRAAFSSYPVDRVADRAQDYCWSRREFRECFAEKDISQDWKMSLRNFCDFSAQLPALEQWMQQQFDEASVERHTPISVDDIAEQKTQAGQGPIYMSRDNVSETGKAYLSEFQRYVTAKMTKSLSEVIQHVKQWAENGAGVGIPGDLLGEMLHHSEWARQKCDTFFGREQLVEQLIGLIDTPQVDRTGKFKVITAYVVGVSGAGKTALMAKAAESTYRRLQLSQDQSQRHPIPVLVRFCGTSPGSHNARNLMISLCHQLEFLYNLKAEQAKSVTLIHAKYEELVAYFHSLLGKYPVVLFIDSLDQLSDEDLGRSQISFLKGLEKCHPDTKIVVSCLPDEWEQASSTGHPCYLYLCEQRLKEAKVPRVDVKMARESHEVALNEAMSILDSLLQQRGRRITEAQRKVVRDRIAEEESKTALYVALAGNLMGKWTSYTDAEQGLRSGRVYGLIEQMYDTLERDYGKELVRMALGFLVCSAKGVSDLEMEDLLSLDDHVLDAVFQYHKSDLRRLSSHVWLRLKGAMQGLLVEGERGCLQLYHRQLREVAEARLDQQVKHRVFRTLAIYFGDLNSVRRQVRQVSEQPWTLDERTPYHESSTVNVRRCEEAAHAMLAAQMYTEAESELCDFAGILSKLRVGQGFQLIEDFTALRSKDSHKYRVDHYWRWLRADIYALSRYPFRDFFYSTLSQPTVSELRTEAAQFASDLKQSGTFANLSLKYSRKMGISKEFDAMISKLEGHSGHVTSVSFSPDGKQVVSGSQDKTVRIWNVLSGACTSTLEGHTEYVTSVSFSPVGMQVVSGSRDKTLRIWNVLSGACTRILEGHSDCLTSVNFSPDDKQVVSGSYDKTVRIWDVLSGACTHTLKGHSNIVTSVSFSPNGKLVVSGSKDNMIRIWDLLSRACTYILEGHSGPVTSVNFSPDGNQLVSGSEDKIVCIWDVLSGTCSSTLEGHSGYVTSIGFSPDGKQVVSGSYDTTVRIWNVLSETCTSTLKSHIYHVFSVSFSPDGKQIVSGSQDKTMRIWDVSFIGQNNFHSGHVTSVSFSPDGKQIASGSYDTIVRIIEVASGICTNTLEGHSNYVTSVSFSPDGKQVVSGSWDKTVRIWDVLSGACTCVLEGHSYPVTSASFSPDGKQVVSGSEDNTVRVWDMVSGDCTRTLKGHSYSVTSASFSPDGKQVVSGSYDKTVRIWDVLSGTCTRTLEGHSESVTSVSFSPNGKQVVSGSWDMTVCIWDVVSGNCTRTLEGHTNAVTSVSFSPDGKEIVSGSEDKIIRIWDTLSGACTSTLEGHSNIVTSVSFSPDGKQVVSGSEDKTVRIWDVWFGANTPILEAHSVCCSIS